MTARRSILALLAGAAAALDAQPPRNSVAPIAPAPGTHASATVAVAVRTMRPPVIDGSDADPIWTEAQAIDSFVQFVPHENARATFRTVAKVAYDEKFLYVFVRMYDPHPDSIVGLLTRRDQYSRSDWVKILIDSYHDKRSGYEFAVNPRGVKRDIYTYNDGVEDDSWDGIWDVAVRTDSLGWAAEFRIPFDQLRFADRPQITMGLAIARDVARLNERDSWPSFRLSKPGIASQFGEITGIDGVGASRHLEIIPYLVLKNITTSAGIPYPSGSTLADSNFGRQQQMEVGGDIKYGVTSNLTLDATVNPDFGQVESDPAVLNLTNFETFLPERRPFFVEGTGIFRFDLLCPMGTCQTLFYSRRIGRQPQLSNGAEGTPTTTSIIAAGKLTGRLSSGLSIGVLDALTAREVNNDVAHSTAEPATNYFAGQLLQELRGGETQIGAMLTGVTRQLDQFTTDSIRETALTGGVQFVNRFEDRQWQLVGWAVGSRVTGSPNAIAVTQASSVHYYQRPGSGLHYDTTRTSLTGDGAKIGLEKLDGVFRVRTSLVRVSPGMELNDLGFLSEAGTQSWHTTLSLVYKEAKAFYRQMEIDAGETNDWTTQGLSYSYMSANTLWFNIDAQLKNTWWVHGGIEGNRFLGAYDDRKMRGGPAIYSHPYHDGWFGFAADSNRLAVPAVDFQMYDGSGGLSHGWSLAPSVLVHFSPSISFGLQVKYALDWNYVQWVDNLYHTAGLPAGQVDTVNTIGTLHQNTLSATVRFDAMFTPRLSFQFYLQPFLSDGRYENWRELVSPRAHNYGEQYAPYTPTVEDSVYEGCGQVTVACYNFNDQQLNLNTVLRWEYRPGSTLYVVWTHGRNLYNYDQTYQGFAPGSDMNSMLSIHPQNTFLIKASYWFSI